MEEIASATTPMCRFRNLLSRLGRRADEEGAAALTAVRSAPLDPTEGGAVRVITRTAMELPSVAVDE